MENIVDRDVGSPPCRVIASAILSDASQGCGSLENHFTFSIGALFFKRNIVLRWWLTP
jgi:hypothetical protein